MCMAAGWGLTYLEEKKLDVVLHEGDLIVGGLVVEHVFVAPHAPNHDVHRAVSVTVHALVHLRIDD